MHPVKKLHSGIHNGCKISDEEMFRAHNGSHRMIYFLGGAAYLALLDTADALALSRVATRLYGSLAAAIAYAATCPLKITHRIVCAYPLVFLFIIFKQDR